MDNSETDNLANFMEGVASIALLPSGSISGHFIHLPHSACYGLYGTDNYKKVCAGIRKRFIELLPFTYSLPFLHEICLFSSRKRCSVIESAAESKRERDVVVECKGHDAARIRNVEHAHGWEEEVMNTVTHKHGKTQILVTFDCETLKAEKAAEDHIKRYMPKLAGMDAVVNIGPMTMTGLKFEPEDGDDTD